MPHLTLTEYLIKIRCPVCGSAGCTVLRPDSYAAGQSLDEFKEAFRASSDNQLLDQLVQCTSCDLVYINPRVIDEILYEGYSEAVDPEFVAQNPERIKTFTRTLQGIMKHLKIPPQSNLKILDVGCAGGAFLVAAKNCGLHPVGIEPSHWLAEFGRKTYGLEVHQGILQGQTFPPGSFDLVSMWDVIEHVPDPAALLKTIHSVLRPDGTIIVNYPDYGSWAARLLGNKWPFLLSVHLVYYTRSTIREQLRRAGFRVSLIRPHFQTLPFGYILRRMTPYVGLADYLRRAVESLGIGGLSVYYNMGQTLVIAKKDR